jgi:hypothetical protein
LTHRWVVCDPPPNPPDLKKAMPNEQRPSDAELDELSARLNDGLKTCRAMIENYRAMLGGDQSVSANGPEKSASGDTAA